MKSLVHLKMVFIKTSLNNKLLPDLVDQTSAQVESDAGN